MTIVEEKEPTSAQEPMNCKTEGLENLQRQYEFLGDHLKYHDSNIFKMLTIYFGFTGLYLVNLDKFTEYSSVSAVLVLLVGASFAAFLVRTSRVLRYVKRTMRKIDDHRRSVLGENWSFEVVPEFYVGKSPRLFRKPAEYPTSLFGAYVVLATAILVCAITVRAETMPLITP